MADDLQYYIAIAGRASSRTYHCLVVQSEVVRAVADGPPLEAVPVHAHRIHYVVVEGLGGGVLQVGSAPDAGQEPGVKPVKAKPQCQVSYLSKPNHSVKCLTCQSQITVSSVLPVKAKSQCQVSYLSKPNHSVKCLTCQSQITVSNVLPVKAKSQCQVPYLSKPNHSVKCLTCQSQTTVSSVLPAKAKPQCQVSYLSKPNHSVRCVA